MATMKVYFLILAVLFGVNADAGSKEEALKSYVSSVLQNLRQDMPDGIEVLDIPVMEPFTLPHYERTRRVGFATKIDLETDIVLSGISKFNLTSMKVDPKDMVYDATFSIPRIGFTNSTYKLHVHSFGFTVLHREGPIIGFFENVKVNVKMDLGKSGDSVIIEDFKVHITFDRSSIHLKRWDGRLTFWDLVEPLFNAILPDIYDNFEPVYIKLLNGEIRKRLNAAIEKNEAVEALFLGVYDI